MRRLPPSLHRFWALVLALSLSAVGLVIVSAVPAAAASRAFTPAFTANATGDIIIRGNTLMTCKAGSSQAQTGGLTCAATQTGGSQQNNNFFMDYVDADGTAGNSTFDSSSANVTVPAGATVLYAGLSWGATTGAGALKDYPALSGVAAPDATARDKAKFKVPGATSYADVQSTTTDTSGSPYQAYVDVTAAVQAAGSGTYTVADVQAGTGGGNYAGWSLAVAYSDPTLPSRNLVVFTGFDTVSSTVGGAVDIPVSGFTTPLTGAVTTKIGVVAYEGDKGSTGDSMSIGSTPLYNSLNPISDVFNASLTDLNVAVTDRTPSYANLLGFDIDRFDATGALANGSTSTVVHLTTSGDTYYPGVMTFVTDLYSSALTATKTVVDVNGGSVSRGDRLNYSVTVRNGGGDGASATTFSDAAPAGTTYVNGSLTVGGVAVTDATGDDTGDVTTGNVSARLGTGATSSAGGTLAPTATSIVTFAVTVNSNVADGASVVNTAVFNNRDQTTGVAYSGGSNTVTSAVLVPPTLIGTLAAGTVTAPYSSGFTLGSGTGTGPFVWSITSGTLPAGLTLNTSTGVISGTPTAAGSSSITVQAVDSNSRIATRTQLIVVAAAPTVTFLPPTGEVGVAYTAQPSATGGTGSYTWAVSAGTLPAGLSISSTTGAITGTPTAAGVPSITVQATDANAVTATSTATLTIVPVPTLSGTLDAAEKTAPYGSRFTVNDGVGPFVWSITTGTLPTGLTLNTATGLISGTPTGGSATVTVQVTDANGRTATRSGPITVADGPTVTFTPPTGEVGVAYTAQPTAAGGTGSYTWAISTGTLPAGLSINPTTGAITGTPTAAGTPTVTVQATDTSGGTATQTRTLTIVAAPTLSGTLAAGEKTAPYSSGFTVNDGVGPFVWSISSGTLPAGLTLNTATGLISGAPTGGSATITVQVTDANGRTATRSGSITLADGPTVTFTPPTGEVGVAYTAQPSATGGTGSYTWAVSAGTLPAGLSINPTTGTITGTPTAAGTPSITVQATDASGGTATQARTLTIVAAPALTFPTSLSGPAHSAYSRTLSFTGGLGPFVWSISAGALPAGLTLDPDTGVLSGTPTAGGSSTFTVRIVDKNGLADTRSATMSVSAAASTVSLSAPASARFGTSVTLTSTVGPSSPTGTVTFTDVPTTGPQAGTTVTLGTATVSGGTASLSTTLPAFGVNAVTAAYGGDSTHAAATSATTQVEVSAYAGEVIVTEFRWSGPGGAGDNYVELLNTGPAVPLAGIKITADSGEVSTLPANAGILGTGRSYLLTGAGFSLGAIATPDDSVATVGIGGTRVTAPDTASTTTDAAGPATGFHTGTGLPAITGNPDSQWAWVRAEAAGAAVDSRNNAADFRLVSDGSAAVGGVLPMLGSASPTGTADPYQHNSDLRSALFDPAVGIAVAPNRVVVPGTPGTLTVRKTFTNTSNRAVTAAKVRVTALSEANGDAKAPGASTPPARRANLRVVNPATATSRVSTGGTSTTVQNLSVDAPVTASPGGGLNTTLTVPLPGGGLGPGQSVSVAFTFRFDTGGTFWFAYDVDAVGGTVGANRVAQVSKPTHPLSASRQKRLAAQDRNGSLVKVVVDSGRLR